MLSNTLEGIYDVSDTEVARAGYLSKQGGAKGGFKNWKRRWFVLKEGSLYYYKDAAAKELLGVMPLQGSTLLFLKTPSSQTRPPMLESKVCAQCQTKFTLTTRRHHCRKCGDIFCHACSSNEAPLPELDYDEPVRVCNRCYTLSLANVHRNAITVPLRSQAYNLLNYYERTRSQRSLVGLNHDSSVAATQTQVPLAGDGTITTDEALSPAITGVSYIQYAQHRRAGSLAELLAVSPLVTSRAGPFIGSPGAFTLATEVEHSVSSTFGSAPAADVSQSITTPPTDASICATTPPGVCQAGKLASSLEEANITTVFEQNQTLEQDESQSAFQNQMQRLQPSEGDPKTLGEALTRAGTPSVVPQLASEPTNRSNFFASSPYTQSLRRSSGAPQFTLPTVFYRHLFALKNSERELWMKADTQEEQMAWVDAILRVARVRNPTLGSPPGIPEGSLRTEIGIMSPQPVIHLATPTVDHLNLNGEVQEQATESKDIAPAPLVEGAVGSHPIEPVFQKPNETATTKAGVEPTSALEIIVTGSSSQDQLAKGPSNSPEPTITSASDAKDVTPASTPFDHADLPQTSDSHEASQLSQLPIPMLRKPQLSISSSRDAFAATWRITPQSIRLGPKVGSGAYGDVFRGTLWGTPVAVKKLNPNGRQANVSGPADGATSAQPSADVEVDAHVMEEIRKEISILAKLRHPNVVLYMGACVDANRVSIITEWCPRGSLYDVIYDFDRYFIDASLMIKLSMGIAQGMNYLHSLDSKIIHRDLKSQNVLLDTHLQPKIADFGLSHIRRNKQNEANPVIRRIVRRLSLRQTTPVPVQDVAMPTSVHEEPQDHYGIFGTPEWMAPEVMQGQWYTEKVDVYSYGILLSEIVSRQMPFSDQLEARSYLDVACAVIEHGAMPTLPRWCDQFLRNLIQACLSRNPASRPSFTDIIRHLHDLSNLDEEELFYRFDLPRLKELLAQEGRFSGQLNALAAREIAHLCSTHRVFFHVYSARSGRRSGRATSFVADEDEEDDETQRSAKTSQSPDALGIKPTNLPPARGWAIPEDDVVFLIARLASQLTAEDSEARAAAIHALEGLMAVSNAGGKVFCANRLLEHGALPTLLSLLQGYDEQALLELERQGRRDVLDYPSVFSFLQNTSLASVSAGAPDGIEDESQVSASVLLGLTPVLGGRGIDPGSGAGADVGFRDILSALGREGADVAEVAHSLIEMGVNPFGSSTQIYGRRQSRDADTSGGGDGDTTATHSPLTSHDSRYMSAASSAFNRAAGTSFIVMTLMTGRLLLELTSSLARVRDPLGWFVPAAPSSIVPFVHALSADLTRFKRARAELSKEIAVRTRVLNIVQDALEGIGLRVLGPERAAFGLESDSFAAQDDTGRDRLHIFKEEVELAQKLAESKNSNVQPE